LISRRRPNDFQRGHGSDTARQNCCSGTELAGLVGFQHQRWINWCQWKSIGQKVCAPLNHLTDCRQIEGRLRRVDCHRICAPVKFGLFNTKAGIWMVVFPQVRVINC